MGNCYLCDRPATINVTAEILTDNYVRLLVNGQVVAQCYGRIEIQRGVHGTRLLVQRDGFVIATLWVGIGMRWTSDRLG